MTSMSVINHDERDFRSAVLFWFCRLVIKPLLRFTPVSEFTLKRLALLDEWAGRGRHPIRGVEIEKAQIAGVSAERMMPHTVDDSRVVVLYMHGGAFMACGLNTHRGVAAAVARGVRAPLVSIDYRQGPTFGVGTSVHDAFRVYRALQESGEFDSIVVVGDSAGGYLGAKLVECCAREGVAGPDAYIGFSPLLNLAPDADRSSRHDAMLPIARLEKLRPFFVRGPEPLFGELDTTGGAVAALFPPAIVIVARDEALAQEAFKLGAALDRAGIRNETHVYAGQVHAFPAAATGSSQARSAISVSTEFVRSVLAEARSANEDDRAESA